MSETVRVRVWDPWVRLTHWSLVLLLGAAYLTAEMHWFRLHTLTGYAVLTLVVFRLLWGVFGSESARFRSFLRPPGEGVRHLRHIHRREADREVTHNAAGGWVVVAFLLLLGAQATLGLFSNDDSFQSGPLRFLVSKETSDWLTGWHDVIFDVLVALVVLHVVALLLYRVLKGQNLVHAMVTGRKTLPAGTAEPRMANPILGAALLAASAAFVWWVSHLG
ncbi:MAG: cytochrome b/b6 domain-containing protein [Acetobacteraceae bacterium]|nr:cytochrome b/b6 domain-containing protein [Acetobacteraceae bacterium]